jgi:cytochrome c biogenesis protein CcmG, thiol:disulfide interchange protein DsbE
MKLEKQRRPKAHKLLGLVLSASALTCMFGTSACAGAAQPVDGRVNNGAASKASEVALVGQLAPEVEFAALHGARAFTLNSLRGSVVLLDFWASWCAPCREELPMLDEMASRLKHKGIEIVAASVDDSIADAEQFLLQQNSWSLNLGYDPGQRAAELFQPPKMPTSYIIDREGFVRNVNAGFQRSDARLLEDQLLALTSDT